MSTLAATRRPDDADALVSATDAAILLGIAPATLAIWRCTRRYPLPYVKIGRCVKYRVSDLEAFVARRTVGAAE